MAYQCFNCKKKSAMGTSHRHKGGVAGRQHLRKVVRTPKKFKPNLHNAFLLMGTRIMRVKLCTKCKRLLRKQGKLKSYQKTAEKKLVVRKAITPEVVEKKKIMVKKEPKEIVKKTTKQDKARIDELMGKKQ